MIKPKSSLKLHLFSGFHDPNLDRQFQSALDGAWTQSGNEFYASLDIQSHSLCDSPSPDSWVSSDPSIYVGFSAGCVRAAIAAQQAKRQGQWIAGIIAIDGWGVPFCDPTLPTYRLSHDLFTHTTASLLGGVGVFFADPPVEHLLLWAQSDQVRGWYLRDEQHAVEMLAVDALVQLIQSMGCAL